METIKNIFRPLLPEFLKKIYRRLKTNLEDYVLLPRKALTYATDDLYTFHNADFMKDPLFAESYALAEKIDNKHCLFNNEIQWRMHVLYWLGNLVKGLEGDFVDCGVATGFCARSLMHYIGFEKLNKKYYLMDSFVGLNRVYSTPKEMKAQEYFKYGENENMEAFVRKVFKGLNVEIIRGFIPDTLQQVKPEKVAFLHLDMNAAYPEVEALDYFWPKISKGGVVLFDDYACGSCHHAKNTHDAWAQKHSVEILSLPTGQGLLIKV